MERLSSKLLNWASIYERVTIDQARLTSSMPFIYPYVALMPDCHLGKGSTVGSVVPTVGAIIPACVGVDIGCGMMAVRTQFTAQDIDDRILEDIQPLSILRESIEAAIPLSAGKYNQYTKGDLKDLVTELENLSGIDDAEEIAGNWRLQLASLGSGNHFIECSYDQENRVWLFLHSGSRGVGNKLANKHIRIAQELCVKNKVHLPDRDLAYLTEDTQEFWDYIRCLQWAQHFALLNREGMMRRVIACFEKWIGSQVKREEVIRCHHNYTTLEHYEGKQVWLSRKGAIDAPEGVMGLIPGSMGAASYVVKGKGNLDALNSAPHGAGRNYSRSLAKKTFTMEQLEEDMRGIEWRHTDAFLDEAPGAYKDIDIIMKDAEDLVEIVHLLRQFVNVKGD